MEKWNQRLTVILFCVFIAGMLLCFIFLPGRTFSEQENRSLAQAPKLTAETLFSGQFTTDLTSYLADQFPMRDSFVKVKSGAELLLGKKENNGVLYSENQLAVRQFDAYVSKTDIAENTDCASVKTVDAQLEAYNRFVEKLDIPVVTVLPPRTVSVTDRNFGYTLPACACLNSRFKEVLKEKTGYIDMKSSLQDAYDRGEYVIYRTDHHWTTNGAYYAYTEILNKLGNETAILPASSFRTEEISDFSGTTAARANFPFYEKDTITLWHFDGENDFEIVADGEKQSGFYDYGRLQTSDKYTVFFGGTHGIMTVRKNNEERKTLLVVKDSFADSLLPFLATEYDLVVADLNTHGDVSSLLTAYNPDALLIVYNEENILTRPTLGNIR